MIQKHSSIQVCEVANNSIILTNTICVMPENFTMTILGNRLTLIPRNLDIKINWAVNLFFQSLAVNSNYNKIAIIFSGMGSDGTTEIERLKANGALVIVRTPESCMERIMPESVIKTGVADHILDPAAMPGYIINHVVSINLLD